MATKRNCHLCESHELLAAASLALKYQAIQSRIDIFLNKGILCLRSSLGGFWAAARGRLRRADESETEAKQGRRAFGCAVRAIYRSICWGNLLGCLCLWLQIVEKALILLGTYSIRRANLIQPTAVLVQSNTTHSKNRALGNKRRSRPC